MNTLGIWRYLLAFVLISTQAWAIEPVSGIRVTPLLKTTHSWVGDRIDYPAGVPEITGQLVELAPGAETGWHQHPVASVGYILQGELTVLFEDGQTRVAKAGEAAVESMHLRHNGKNTATVPTKLIVFYIGTAGGKTTIKTDAEHAGLSTALPAGHPTAQPHSPSNAATAAPVGGPAQ